MGVLLEEAKVQALRSTVEACKSTLSVMLITMMLAERMSQESGSSVADAVGKEQDRAMTQNLIIAQQCAIEELELSEDLAEREEEVLLLLPSSIKSNGRDAEHRRRKSKSRLGRMFSGLSLVTDLPTPRVSDVSLPTRSERASVWLDAVVAPDDETFDPHPGKLRQRRLSSVATANAPMQLLRKWTDQGEGDDSRKLVSQPPKVVEENDLWQNPHSLFSEEYGMGANNRSGPTQEIQRPLRAPTDLVSPKTARVHSAGFHVVAGVDGALMLTEDALVEEAHDDSCEAIIRSILGDHESAASTSAFDLCVLCGGKQKRILPSDKPLQILKHFEELDLDPRLVVRRRATAFAGV